MTVKVDVSLNWEVKISGFGIMTMGVLIASFSISHCAYDLFCTLQRVDGKSMELCGIMMLV